MMTVRCQLCHCHYDNRHMEPKEKHVFNRKSNAHKKCPQTHWCDKCLEQYCEDCADYSPLDVSGVYKIDRKLRVRCHNRKCESNVLILSTV